MASVSQLLTAGEPRAVQAWWDTHQAALTGQGQLVRRAPAVATFRSWRDMTDQQLTALSEPAGAVHTLARVDGAWVTLRDGCTHPVHVPPGGVWVSVTVGAHLYTRVLERTPSPVTGRGSLAGAVLDHLEMPNVPFPGSRPAALVLDAATGLATPASNHLDQWWGPGLHWVGDAVTLTDAALGRRLRDLCTWQETFTGGWAPWAWDALQAYAATPGVCAGEVAKAALCAGADRSLAPEPIWELCEVVASGGATAVEVIAAARALAPHHLPMHRLAVALAGLAPTP